MSEIYTMYPYSYGDRGEGYSVSARTLRVAIFATLPCILLFTTRSVAYEIDGQAILDKIELAMAQNEKCVRASRGTSIVGGASCFLAGVCVSNAKVAIQSGNTPAAIGFVCGAAVFACGDRVADYYGVRF